MSGRFFGGRGHREERSSKCVKNFIQLVPEQVQRARQLDVYGTSRLPAQPRAAFMSFQVTSLAAQLVGYSSSTGTRRSTRHPNPLPSAKRAAVRAAKSSRLWSLTLVHQSQLIEPDWDW